MNENTYVARPLKTVETELSAQSIKYKVITAISTNTRFVTDDQCWYVIRQQLASDGTLLLTAAAKMGKEVS
ncbi:MAG: aliphatic sulfonate ABC transporter [Negativicutes bacterium]|nr:aliphatic sulfonate ABC transporter [Negativicutes bacterium]